MDKISFSKPVDILIIGDAHAKPGVSNDRFKWAGKFAVDREPDVIIDMGDWADMESLSSYDVGKKCYEGRRYVEDIRAANEAREEFNRPIEAENRWRAHGHRKRYHPTKIALGGNHDEGRINKAIEDDRKLDGLIGIKDFEHEAYGWHYVPYREPIEVAGFAFAHYFVSGVMGRPIGGEMPSLSLLRKQYTSCVAGHLHLLDFAHRTKPDGSRIWGIVSGCYMASEQWEAYAHVANRLWWKGLILLKGCQGGDVGSFETITVEELERKYGCSKKS